MEDKGVGDCQEADVSVPVSSILAPDAVDRRIGPRGEHVLSSFGTRMAGAHTQHLASLATLFSELNVATVPPHGVSDAPDSIGRSIGAASSDSSLVKNTLMAANGVTRHVPHTAQDLVFQAISQDVQGDEAVDSDGTLSTRTVTPMSHKLRRF